MTQMNLSVKQKHTYREYRLVVIKGGREVREFGISRCELLYIKWLNNEVLLYSTGNYIQYPMINHTGKEYEKEYICTMNHLAGQQKLIKHYKSTYAPIK